MVGKGVVHPSMDLSFSIRKLNGLDQDLHPVAAVSSSE